MKVQQSQHGDQWFIIDKNGKIIEVHYSEESAKEALDFRNIK